MVFTFECRFIPTFNKKKEINGYFAIDENDFKKVSLLNWYSHDKYARNNKVGFLHRYIMNLQNYDNQKQVDHITQNSYINCKHFLRIKTASENLSSKNKSHQYTSNYYGVFKKGDKWCSFAKNVNLGYSNNEQDAATKYDFATLIFDQKYPKLNFPNEKYNIQQALEFLRKLKMFQKIKISDNLTFELDNTEFYTIIDLIKYQRKKNQLKKENNEITLTNQNINFLKYKIYKVQKYKNFYISSQFYNQFKNYNFSEDKNGYIKFQFGYFHRYLMCQLHPSKGCNQQLVVHHIDSDKKNNAIENLIFVNTSHNNHQQILSKNNTTGYFGVTLKKQQYYESSIKFNKQSIYLGRYNNEKLAAIAYNIKAKQLYGTSPNKICSTNYQLYNNRLEKVIEDNLYWSYKFNKYRIVLNGEDQYK